MTLKTLGSIVAALSVVVGAVIGVESRYVHADELKKFEAKVKDQFAELRRARLEDEVFKLEIIPVHRRTDADKAMLDRYKRQIREIDFRREKEQR